MPEASSSPGLCNSSSVKDSSSTIYKENPSVISAFTVSVLILNM